MQLLTPQGFKDYELIDCGDFEKLERFGKYVTIRPEPQAVWPKVMGNKEWEKHAHVKFVPKSSSSGEWQKLKQMPDQWEIQYRVSSGRQEAVGSRQSAGAEGSKQSAAAEGSKGTSGIPTLKFRLGLTSFKHVGIFPEQASNWDRIYSHFASKPGSKFLNLFAYTGGASIAAKAAGCEVTHVDSIKQVVTWANENMQKSGLDNIRWLVDDALKFVKKEMRRGNRYQGIILDPPAYGHGPTGEKWKLEENIAEMMHGVLEILDPEKHLLILNAYSLGFSALVPENLLRPFASENGSKLEVGELYLPFAKHMKLPLGVFGCLTK